MAYLDTIVAYKEAVRLGIGMLNRVLAEQRSHATVIRAKAGKLSQLMGRQYMRLTWDQIEAHVAALLRNNDPCTKVTQVKSFGPCPQRGGRGRIPMT